MTILLSIVGVLFALFAVGFIHHKIKMKTDPHYRYQVEQAIQDRVAQRVAKQFWDGQSNHEDHP